MDPLVDALVDLVDARPDTPPTTASERAAVVRITDAVGCALASVGTPPTDIARRAHAGSVGRARIIGTAEPTSLEAAAFCNTAMIRQLDYNDAYFSAGSVHPSDIIGVALAAASHARATGRQLIAAVCGAYDAVCGLYDQIPLTAQGWDHSPILAPVAAAVSANLLGLERTAVAHAISMSAVSSVALRQTRRGQLSMWKGFASAQAAKSGMSAALLAHQGATGPPEPFVGTYGMVEQVYLRRPTLGDRAGAIERTHLKWLPCEFHGQQAAELAMSLRPEAGRPRQISEIRVATYGLAVAEIAGEPDKWHPSSREAADHSMPFLIAVALLDGRLDLASYMDDRWRDPAVRELMAKVRIRAVPELTAAYPRLMAARMEIERADGTVVAGAVDHPRGHRDRPLDATAVRAKFQQLSARHLGDRTADETFDRLADLANVADVEALLAATAPTRDA